MGIRTITIQDIAFAYELKHEGWSYEKISEFIGCDRCHLNATILRCEREGIAWVR